MGKPKMPKNMQFDPIEMIEKNAEVNRIDQTNPYGTSQYRTNPQTGQTEFTTEFSPELQGLHEKQMDIANQGTIKDPMAHLAGQGGGIGELMSSMLGKVKDRYMGTEGEADSRQENVFKGDKAEAPPAVAVPPAAVAKPVVEEPPIRQRPPIGPRPPGRRRFDNAGRDDYIRNYNSQR